MRNSLRVFAASAGAVALVLSGGAVASATGTGGSSTSPKAYTCTGGDFQKGNFATIPSGTYASIRVAGACRPTPHAVINVVGNVYVAAGAAFDAQTYPSTINVQRNVVAASGSLLGLGCLPNPTPKSTTGHPCSDAKGHPTTSSSRITVYGNVIATDANTVLLNGITVKGNVTLVGGGGAIPWAIKLNTIRGNLIVSDMTPNWIGVILNKIGGNAILVKVHITDGLPPNNDPKPTIFIASNQVRDNLICAGLGPFVSGGFGTEHNVVGGKAIGQCAHLTDESAPPAG